MTRPPPGSLPPPPLPSSSIAPPARAPDELRRPDRTRCDRSDERRGDAATNESRPSAEEEEEEEPRPLSLPRLTSFGSRSSPNEEEVLYESSRNVTTLMLSLLPSTMELATRRPADKAQTWGQGTAGGGRAENNKQAGRKSQSLSTIHHPLHPGLLRLWNIASSRSIPRGTRGDARKP